LRKKDSDNASEAGENDESRATWKERGDNQRPTTGQKVLRFVETLKREFSNAMKALTHRDDEPKPSSRRKKGEDTSGGFTLAARQIMSRKVSLPAAAYEAAIDFLAETLDWLNPYHQDGWDGDTFDEEFHIPQHDHSSLHL
jgi:hypothetical protein